VFHTYRGIRRQGNRVNQGDVMTQSTQNTMTLPSRLQFVHTTKLRVNFNRQNLISGISTLYIS